MSVMLYPCMLCVPLLMSLFVLCVACFDSVCELFGDSKLSLSQTITISCPLWSSVYEYQRVECAFTSLVRTECGMFVMYCMQCCMSVSALPKSVCVVPVIPMSV